MTLNAAHAAYTTVKEYTMILSIGEILADMIGVTENNIMLFARYAGGAPFNVACDLINLGAKAGFCGRVGDDLIGAFLHDFAHAYPFDTLDLQTDPTRNTTLAFVELDASGERSFCFYRKGTADYHIDTTEVEPLIAKADIVNLGSLMLSEPEGRKVADLIIGAARRLGKAVSFDINFRDDIFSNTSEAVSIYAEYVGKADIVKYSEEEALMFTETFCIPDALSVLKNTGQLSFVTLGKQGSLCVYQGEAYHMDTIPVECVDSTGAGDAFFAGALSVLDGATAYVGEILMHALRVGNICGAITATTLGAINNRLNSSIINEYLSNEALNKR